MGLQPLLRGSIDRHLQTDDRVWGSNIVGKQTMNWKIISKTCTPDDVVAVTDLKSQMTKATRYVLILTVASNWSSRRPLFTSTVLIWNSHTQKNHCTHVLHTWAQTHWACMMTTETYYRHVGQRNVLWTPPDPYGEISFEAWLIKTGESHSSTCGLEVSWG